MTLSILGLSDALSIIPGGILGEDSLGLDSLEVGNLEVGTLGCLHRGEQGQGLLCVTHHVAWFVIPEIVCVCPSSPLFNLRTIFQVACTWDN